MHRLRMVHSNNGPDLGEENAVASSSGPDASRNSKLSWGTCMRLQNAALVKENAELKTAIKSQQDTIAHLTAMLAERKYYSPKADAFSTCKTTFMTLPVEIRLSIYSHLLVARYRHDPTYPKWGASEYEHGFKKRIKFDTDRPHFTKNYLEPAILRTCRQINQEALPVLYGMNMFNLMPLDLSNLVTHAGLANLRMIKNITILVAVNKSLKQLPEYLRMLRILADKATGFSHLEVRWYAAPKYKTLVFEKRNRGVGDDLEFGRALNKIQNLDSLLLEGYYAKGWPEYLKRTMSVPVTSYQGFRYEIEHEHHVLMLEAGILEDQKKRRSCREGNGSLKCIKWTRCISFHEPVVGRISHRDGQRSRKA